MPEPVVNLPHEVWASIPGYRGYWVSSEGRVRSRRGILKLNSDPKGHLAVRLLGRRVLVHRLVAKAFVINPDPAHYWLVRHLDGDPARNTADNVAWGDTALNIKDAQLHGTKPIARHGTASKYRLGCRCHSCTAAAAADAHARYTTDPHFNERKRAANRRYLSRKKAASPFSPQEAS